MDEHPKFAFVGLGVAFILNIAVAIVWWYADLYPDQIPQTRAELLEAVASIVLVGTQILLLVVFVTLYRRRSSPLTWQRPPKFINTAEQLTQTYIHFHGNSMVSIVAILCLTFVAVQRMPTVTPPFTTTTQPPTTVSTALDPPPPVEIITPSSSEPEILVLTAEGYGKASQTATTPAQRERTAIQAAKLTGSGKLAEDLVGIEIQIMQQMQGAEITENTIRKTVQTWMPASEVVAQRYDDTTGEAFVTVRLSISKAEREELRQQFKESK